MMKYIFIFLVVLAGSVSAEPLEESQRILSYMAVIDPDRSTYSQDVWDEADLLKAQVESIQGKNPMPEDFISSQITTLRGELPAPDAETP